MTRYEAFKPGFEAICGKELNLDEAIDFYVMNVDGSCGKCAVHDECTNIYKRLGNCDEMPETLDDDILEEACHIALNTYFLEEYT